MNLNKLFLFLLFISLTSTTILAQVPIKNLHYAPFGKNGFKSVETKRKFNRALYGGNTAFRVEAGDLPEFALYLPGMGGNCQLGIISGTKSKWITEANTLQSVYQDGAMHYLLTDALWEGKLEITVTATYTHEAMLIKVNYQGKSQGLQLVMLYGGVTAKKFSRDGDIGADPESSFYLKPEYCLNNVISIQNNTFTLAYNPKDVSQQMQGILPLNSTLKIGDANNQKNPTSSVQASENTKHPCLIATTKLIPQKEDFILIQKITPPALPIPYTTLANLAEKNQVLRAKIYNTVQINTPDSLINPLGQALSLAADAIWDTPTYMHGAIAWRMRLPAWRGPYVADALGQHDRAKTHFSAYAKSQVQSNFPHTNAHPDSAMHYAREVEKIGSGIFTEGYICRNPNGEIKAHHYDMNLVYIDQLLTHFNWTSDTAYLREMFPILEKHLAWEKHNFDADNDGLYDAYCCIWASDALQYSGGAVTHSTAYNYRAFKMAAQLAKLLGKDSAPYQQEANKIYKALQDNLWLEETGCFAEYKDALGLQLTHPSAGLWTIYHAIDSEVASPTQLHKMTEYIDKKIPHIPFRIPALNQDFYLLSTTNWQPYTWSINNVALGENLHTALACWQAQNPQLAFEIWRNTLIESLYTSASPGGFEQLSSLDAVRGELYRDFADGVGMAARSLVEGLFGVTPKLLQDSLIVRPGFPLNWQYASLKTATITIDFKKKAGIYQYTIHTNIDKKHHLNLQIPTDYSTVKKVLVNHKAVGHTWLKNPSSLPLLSINTQKENDFIVEVVFDTDKPIKSLKKSAWQANPIPVLLTETPTMATGKVVPLDIHKAFNDKVTQIFNHDYTSPRPQTATLQLPIQGIGNWCYPLIKPLIDDAGVRQKAKQQQETIYYNNIGFTTPSDSLKNNIAFVSKWDNFPDTLTIPLYTKGKKLHVLMAGTTNPMQSQLVNGKVIIHYTDGSTQDFQLHNPDNWLPIEQDYFYDGNAFSYNQAQQPVRLHLKTGEFVTNNHKYVGIKGFSNYGIEGGAANMYVIKVQEKPIEAIGIVALCNDVIIGLMAISIEK